MVFASDRKMAATLRGERWSQKRQGWCAWLGLGLQYYPEPVREAVLKGEPKPNSCCCNQGSFERICAPRGWALALLREDASDHQRREEVLSELKGQQSRYPQPGVSVSSHR